jgi:hypothetical protein
MTKLQAAEDRYITGLTTPNLIKLIESTTKHQAGLTRPLSQAHNLEQLQRLQTELFSRLA